MVKGGKVFFKRRALKRFACALLALTLLVLTGCAALPEDHTYGVFLSVTEDLPSLGAYETVVIDAQYFTKEEIGAFRDEGHQVYSYLNVGSLEDFRSYYEDYKDEFEDIDDAYDDIEDNDEYWDDY